MAITYMVLDGYMVVDTILQTRGKNLLKARKVEEDVGPSRQGYYDLPLTYTVRTRSHLSFTCLYLILFP